MQRSSEASQFFFKIKLKLWENVPKEAAFKCPAAKLKFFSIRRGDVEPMSHFLLFRSQVAKFS